MFPGHFEWSWNLGDIVVSVPIVVLIGVLWRFQATLIFFRIEHEDLMVDYCDRKGIKLADLSTRRLKRR
jgi:hypothetical protein